MKKSSFRPTRPVLTAALLCAVCFAGMSALSWAEESPATTVVQVPETVRALRYRIKIYDSELAVLHNSGRWIQELYFPDQGVVCNVVVDIEATEKGELRRYHRMHAFYSPIRNKYRLQFHEKERTAPTQEVQIPYARAQQIFELAELTRRLRQAERTLGAAASASGLLRAEAWGEPKAAAAPEKEK